MLKYCAFFSLWAGLGLASDYMTYQAARLVIGQTTFTSQNSGATNTLLGSGSGIAFAANTFFYADGNRLGLTPVNNRVLLFGNVTQSMPQPLSAIPNFIGRCPVCVGQATVVLGQPDFTSTNINTSQTGMRTPTAVASDGQILAVADTANNRVLIWNSIPTTNGQPADLVLGQPDFNTVEQVGATASSLRAPQGVWVQNGRLFVADTQNNRIMIWNSIPTHNNQAADIVLGQPNFTTVIPINQSQANLVAAANTMLSPVSVSSDGTHLLVADLGFNRALIWNSIPTQNQQPADVEIGQPDMVSALQLPDNAFTGIASIASGQTTQETPVLCTVPTGIDFNDNPTYPNVCGRTLAFPRFVLSDGTRLYVADSGNDRVLIYETIPTQNAPAADVILGQPDEFSDVVTSAANGSNNPNTPNLTQSASNVIPEPTSLAWDGSNLYVDDPTNYRVLVFTPAETNVAANGVRNAASIENHATDTITLGGTITSGDVLTVTICGPVNGVAVNSCTSTSGNETNYTYTVTKTDTFDTILQGIEAVINANSGDPNVYAVPELGAQILLLVARASGSAGNFVSVATSVSSSATLTSSATSVTLSGGNDPVIMAPGTLISIMGTNLADAPVSASVNTQQLPYQLGGVQVYVDGILTPLMYVSSTQINAQIPWEVTNANSSSLYVRTLHADGSVTITDAVGIPIDQQNPGLFALGGQDPRPAIAFHGSSYADGIISVDGSIDAGDIGDITIGANTYTYSVQSTDTLASIRDAFIAQINANSEEVVTASAAPAFTRILLQAKVAGPDGDGIAIGAFTTSSTSTTAGTAAGLALTATNSALCCANVAGAPITTDNPTVPGETIYLYATGLGLVYPEAAKDAIVDGGAYPGPALNIATSSVSSLVGGLTANLVSAGLAVGGIGVYQIVLQLDPSIPTNAITQVTIAQSIYTSNIVTIPVYNPNPTPSQ